MEKHKDKVKRRSDYGQVRLTEIDLKLLRWMGEQYAVNEAHLRTLASRASPVVEGGGLLSPSGVRRRYGRWQRAGWVHKQKILADHAPWLWLTRKGIRHLGLEYAYYRPSVAKLRHIDVVNQVRLYAEDRFSQGDRWVSERQLLQEIKQGERAKASKHLVDAEVHFGGVAVGVEVELTVKSKKRLRKILQDLAQHYEAVWYFLAADCHRAVAQAVAEMPNHAYTFALYELADLMPDDEHT
ncbi:MAG: hypothetical protein J5I90_04675 [Caldilineales bacterium]|nr:hypothetical protein [Caldilineales bacterium]